MKHRERYWVYKYVSSGAPIYIGITINIVRRIREHRNGKGLDSKFIPYLEKCEIYVHECSTETEMRALEALLIEYYKPVLNEQGKTEAPSSLLLTDDLVKWIAYKESDYIEAMYAPKQNDAPCVKGVAAAYTPNSKGAPCAKSKARYLHHNGIQISECINEIRTLLHTIEKYPSVLENEYWDIEIACPSCEDKRMRWSTADIFISEHLPGLMILSEQGWESRAIWGSTTIKGFGNGKLKLRIHVNNTALKAIKNTADDILEIYEKALETAEPARISKIGMEKKYVDKFYMLSWDYILRNTCCA